MKEYLSGPIAHIHSRPEDNPAQHHVSEFIQFTPEGFHAYIQRLTGNQAVEFIDTDHPVYSERNMDFSVKIKDIWDETGQNLELRRKILEEMLVPEGRIYTGVEADIISQKGELSVDDTTLKSLDVVTASFHYSKYAKISGLTQTERELGINEIMELYMNVVVNPNIDVLGHPSRDIQAQNKDPKYISLWVPILEAMSKFGIAFEINFGHLKLYSPEHGFDAEIVKLAHEFRVPFIIGFDVHSLSDFGSAFPRQKLITRENSDLAFESNIGRNNFSFFRSLSRNIRKLRKIGVCPDEIVNSSQERFQEWIRLRKIS